MRQGLREMRYQLIGLEKPNAAFWMCKLCVGIDQKRREAICLILPGAHLYGQRGPTGCSPRLRVSSDRVFRLSGAGQRLLGAAWTKALLKKKEVLLRHLASHT